jgi:hypothetical protein
MTSQHFVEDKIRSTNHNLAVVALLCLAGCGWYAMSGGIQVARDWIEPPWVVPASMLTQGQRVGNFPRTFVQVTGDSSVDIGTESHRSSPSSTKHIDAKIAMLHVTNGVLLLRTEADDAEGKLIYTGTLKDIPNDVSEDILQHWKDEDPQASAQLLPFMLDATDHQGNERLLLAVSLAFLVFGIWKLKDALTRSIDISRHPALKRLRRYGDWRKLANDINAEMIATQGGKCFGRARVTNRWIIAQGHFSLRARPFTDVVWIYPKVTRHTVNSIPAGTEHTAIIESARSVPMEIRCGANEVGPLVQEVSARAPWANVGYTDSNVRSMTSDSRGSTIKEVFAKRDAILRESPGDRK